MCRGELQINAVIDAVILINHVGGPSCLLSTPYPYEPHNTDITIVPLRALRGPSDVNTWDTSVLRWPADISIWNRAAQL